MGGDPCSDLVLVWTSSPQMWRVSEVPSRPSLSIFRRPSLVPLYTGNRTSFHGVECSGIYLPNSTIKAGLRPAQNLILHQTTTPSTSLQYRRQQRPRKKRYSTRSQP